MPDREGSVDTRVCSCKAYLRSPSRAQNSRRVLGSIDRALFIWLYRRCPRILGAITIVKPETVVRRHRKGFAAYWRWRSRSPGGRPRIAQELRDLIRRMSLENPAVGRHAPSRCPKDAGHFLSAQ